MPEIDVEITIDEFYAGLDTSTPARRNQAPDATAADSITP